MTPTETSGMIETMEHSLIEKRIVDVTGLPEEAVKAVETLVISLRQQASHGTSLSSYEDWSRALPLLGRQPFAVDPFRGLEP